MRPLAPVPGVGHDPRVCSAVVRAPLGTGLHAGLRLGLHAGLMATLLSGLLRTSLTAQAATDVCEVVEPDVPARDIATLPVGLLYRRVFFGDDRLVAPWAELTRAHLGEDDARPGGGLRIDAAAGAALRLAPESAVPIGAASRLRVQVSATAAARIEIELHDDRAGTRLYRPFELVPGENVIDVRMVDLRYDRGVIPRLDRATRWGVRFVDAGEFELEAFELWRDDEYDVGRREIDALRDDFDDPSTVSTFRRGPFVLLTDARGLDPQAVFDALDDMHARVTTLLPSMPATARPVPLLVFADADEYARFWRRYPARMGAAIGPRAQDEGLTWLGVATASWSPAWARVRPTFVHEAHHALLERSYGLSAGRSWLLEGLAILEQLEISGQDMGPVYRQGLRRHDAPSVLHALIDGSPIDTRRYWQAALLAQWLTADPGRRAALDAALVEMAARGDTDLRPLAVRYFGAEFGTLAVEFWSWAWLAYGG